MMPNMKIWKEIMIMDNNNTKYDGDKRDAGMNCPKCGTFIKTSIFQLLTTNALVCPSCKLRLNIDRIKSRNAFDALRKVQSAIDNLERKSHFNR